MTKMNVTLAKLYTTLKFKVWIEQIKCNLPAIKKITLLLILAILVAFLFNWLHIPIAWLLGPMIVGIIYAALAGKAQPLPSIFGITGQAIIAIFTASRFSLDTLIMVKDYALPLLLCIGVTGSMSLFNGYLLWRFADVDRPSSFLGCIPGSGASMVAMSEEMGADALAVAVLQYVRIFMVSVIIPTLASIFFPGRGDSSVLPLVSPDSLASPPLIVKLIILIICGAVGIWLGEVFKLPSSLFLGPFFASLLIFWLLPYQLTIPPVIFTGGLFLLGLSIGVKFDWEIARKLFKAVLIDVFLILALILICFLVGYEFHLITEVDTMTAVLGSTPGGLSSMIATVIELGGDSRLVLAMQMTRMLLILTLSPFFAASLLKKNRCVTIKSAN